MNSLFIRNLFFLFTSLIFITSCSSHQEIPVWEISKENALPSYMVGTIDYVSKKENGNLISNFLTEKFNNSNTYITQIDILNSDFIITKQWLEIGMDKTLKEVMEAKDFEKLTQLYSEFIKDSSSSISAPDSVKMKLLFYLQDMIFSNNQDNFYFEQFWMKQAMASKKQLIGMETYQDFYKTLSQIPMEDQLKFMNSISSIKEFKTKIEKAIRTEYKYGEYKEIAQTNLTSYTYLQPNYSTLFSKKHTIWMAKIDSTLSKGNTFISLDISHLVGKDNFIETLLSKGYKVKKIK